MSANPNSLAAMLLLAVSCWPLPAHCAQTPQAIADVQPVRRFGYLIGDEVCLDVRIAVPESYALDTNTLPKPGRANAFLELRAIEPRRGLLATIGGDSALRYSLRFLVVNSETEVATVSTPPLILNFVRSGAPPLHVTLPEIVVTVSPLTPRFAAGTEGLDELRADAPAPLVSTRRLRLRLVLYLFFAVALGVTLAWRQGWLPKRMLKRRPFAQAAADIARLGNAAAPEAQAQRARRLHRAFDQAAGFTVASHTLERFFAAQPRFSGLEPQIRDFFSASARFFYADERAALLDPTGLRRLARALAERETRKHAAS